MHLHVTLFRFLLLDFFSVWVKRCHWGHLPTPLSAELDAGARIKAKHLGLGPKCRKGCVRVPPPWWTLTSKLAQAACRSATLEGGGPQWWEGSWRGRVLSSLQSHPKLVGLPRGVYLQRPPSALMGSAQEGGFKSNSAIRREIRMAFPSSLQPPVRP